MYSEHPDFWLQIFDKFKADNIPVVPMSTLTEEGIMDVKTEACDRLLAQRVEQKSKGRKASEIVNRLHVAVPAQRDAKVRRMAPRGCSSAILGWSCMKMVHGFAILHYSESS